VKVVITRCYGNFDLSEEAREMIGIDTDEQVKDISRCDPRLVDAVEKLGRKANTLNSILKVVEIPDDVDTEIVDEGGVEGMEVVREISRVWF
jgi:hypothetical protein